MITTLVLIEYDKTTLHIIQLHSRKHSINTMMSIIMLNDSNDCLRSCNFQQFSEDFIPYAYATIYIYIYKINVRLNIFINEKNKKNKIYFLEYYTKLMS